MNVLVCGGAGYIGSHVALALDEAGHNVSIYDDLSSGLKSNIHYPFYQNSILDYQSLIMAMIGKDAIIHLAAFKSVGESMTDPAKYSVNNLIGTLNMLNAAIETGVKYVVFSSSAAVYGTPQYLPIDEQHPTNPESYYGFTKLDIERYLKWYAQLKPIRYAALRYFNAAGYDPKGRLKGLEKGPSNLIPIVMETAVGKREFVQVYGDDYDTIDGTGVRDYVHVSDLADGHVLALEYLANSDSNLTVNLGSESGLSVKEIIDFTRKITGRHIEVQTVGRRAGDCATVTASSKMARQLLKWNPKYSDIETILQTTWNAYDSTRS